MVDGGECGGCGVEAVGSYRAGNPMIEGIQQGQASFVLYPHNPRAANLFWG